MSNWLDQQSGQGQKTLTVVVVVVIRRRERQTILYHCRVHSSSQEPLCERGLLTEQKSGWVQRSFFKSKDLW